MSGRDHPISSAALPALNASPFVPHPPRDLPAEGVVPRLSRVRALIAQAEEFLVHEQFDQALELLHLDDVREEKGENKRARIEQEILRLDKLDRERSRGFSPQRLEREGKRPTDQRANSEDAAFLAARDQVRDLVQEQPDEKKERAEQAAAAIQVEDPFEMYGVPIAREALVRGQQIGHLERARDAFRRFQAARHHGEGKTHLSPSEESAISVAEEELLLASRGQSTNYRAVVEGNRIIERKAQRERRQSAFEVEFKDRAGYLRRVHEKVARAVREIKEGKVIAEGEDFGIPEDLPERASGADFPSRDLFLAFLRSLRQHSVPEFVRRLEGKSVPKVTFDVLHALVSAVSPEIGRAMHEIRHIMVRGLRTVRLADDFLELKNIEPALGIGESKEGKHEVVEMPRPDTATNRVFDAAANLFAHPSREAAMSLVSQLGTEITGFTDEKLAGLLESLGVPRDRALNAAQLIRQYGTGGALLAGAQEVKHRIQINNEDKKEPQQQEPQPSQSPIEAAEPQPPIPAQQPPAQPQEAQSSGGPPPSQSPIAQPPGGQTAAPQPQPQPGPALIPIDQKEEASIDRGEKSTDDSRQWDFLYPGQSTLKAWGIADGPVMDQKVAGWNAECQEFGRRYDPSSESDNPFYWAQISDDQLKGELPKGGDKEVFEIDRFWRLSRFPIGSDMPIVGQPPSTKEESLKAGIPAKSLESSKGVDFAYGGMRYQGGCMPRWTADYDLHTNPMEPNESSVHFNPLRDMNNEYELGLTNPSLGWLATPGYGDSEGKLLPNDNMTRVDKEVKETVVGIPFSEYEDRSNAYPYMLSKPMNITRHVPRNWESWYGTGVVVHDRDGASEWYPGIGFREQLPDPKEKLARSGPPIRAGVLVSDMVS